MDEKDVIDAVTTKWFGFKIITVRQINKKQDFIEQFPSKSVLIMCGSLCKKQIIEGMRRKQLYEERARRPIPIYDQIYKTRIGANNMVSCPNCNAKREHYSTWIKSDNNVGTHYCHNCKKVFKLTHIFEVLNTQESEEIINDLEKGIKISQYKGNFISDFIIENNYVRSYDELINIPFVKAFMACDTDEGEFIQFKISQNTEKISVINYNSQAVLLAQYTLNRRCVAHLWGNYSILGLATLTENHY